VPIKVRLRGTGLLFLLILAGASAREGFGQAAPKADPVVESINAMRSSIVQIQYNSDAPGPQANGIAGTGFFVSSEGYVITAGHVITETAADVKAKGATKIGFRVAISLDSSSVPNARFRGSFTITDCTVVDVDQKHDIALLKLVRNPFTGELRSGVVIVGTALTLSVGTAKLNPDLPQEGDSALVSGYPLSIPTLVTQRGMVASESFAEIRTQPPNAPTGFLMTEVEDLILLDALVNPGNSGGPVYLTGTDYVFGICQGYRNSPLFTNQGAVVNTSEGALVQNSGLATVIPIKYAIALLEKNKVLVSAKTQGALQP
jgi:S1-C subfamily serine protease